MNDACNNIGKYNPKKERKILRAFDDMIIDMTSNQKYFTRKSMNYSLAVEN